MRPSTPGRPGGPLQNRSIYYDKPYQKIDFSLRVGPPLELDPLLFFRYLRVRFWGTENVLRFYQYMVPLVLIIVVLCDYCDYYRIIVFLYYVYIVLLLFVVHIIVVIIVLVS